MTGTRCARPSRYCAYRAAFDELPREAMRTYWTSSRAKTLAISGAFSAWRSISRASAPGCSSSSDSSHDTSFASIHHAHDVEPAVEHEDVGSGTRVEEAA